MSPSHSHSDLNSKQSNNSPHGRDYSETPLIVTWEVTQACELECDHCRAEAQPDRHPDELTTEQGKALLDQITDFGTPPQSSFFQEATHSNVRICLSWWSTQYRMDYAQR